MANLIVMMFLCAYMTNKKDYFSSIQLELDFLRFPDLLYRDLELFSNNINYWVIDFLYN